MGSRCDRVLLREGRRKAMATSLKVYYDADGKTLTVWFDDPNKEFIADQARWEVLNPEPTNPQTAMRCDEMRYAICDMRCEMRDVRCPTCDVR